MVVIIAAAAGVLFFLAAMYACLIVGSRMDDEMTDLYQRNREEHNGDKDEEKSEHAGAAYDREASGKTL